MGAAGGQLAYRAFLRQPNVSPSLNSRKFSIRFRARDASLRQIDPEFPVKAVRASENNGH